jgi:uncharacterized membrane protein SirB2
VARVLTLFFHFIGFGLLLTTTVAGYILNAQYKKAPDFQSKAIILRSMKPIGLLSPIALLLMLITGIGNMQMLGYTVLDLPGWLAYKIVLFAIAIISGIIFSVKSRKRATLVQEIASGKAPSNAQEMVGSYDKQINLFYFVLSILIIMILLLSINGRMGG